VIRERFVEPSSHHRDHTWKIPAPIGPYLRQQIIDSHGMFSKRHKIDVQKADSLFSQHFAYSSNFTD
jgi:hypothetical protein